MERMVALPNHTAGFGSNIPLLLKFSNQEARFGQAGGDAGCMSFRSKVHRQQLKVVAIGETSQENKSLTPDHPRRRFRVSPNANTLSTEKTLDAPPGRTTTSETDDGNEWNYAPARGSWRL